MLIKTCLFCKNEFKADRQASKFCNHSCAGSYYGREHPKNMVRRLLHFNCGYCGKAFSNYKQGSRFCSHVCHRAGLKAEGRVFAKAPSEKRFWDKVAKTENPNDCWLWLGGTYQNGYGEFLFNGKLMPAHRVAYILKYGEIKDGLFVCHNCPSGDNPKCVNWNHLWLGTHADNMRDMLAKGRGRWQRRMQNAAGY